MNLVKSMKHGRSADKPLTGRRRRSINRSKIKAKQKPSSPSSRKQPQQINDEEKNNGEEEKEEPSNHANKLNEEKIIRNEGKTGGGTEENYCLHDVLV